MKRFACRVDGLDTMYVVANNKGQARQKLGRRLMNTDKFHGEVRSITEAGTWEDTVEKMLGGK